jgi:hypothetical protein
MATDKVAFPELHLCLFAELIAAVREFQVNVVTG